MPQTVDTIYDNNGRVRARISFRPPNTYLVDVERLIDAEDAGGTKRSEFWSGIAGLSSVTDNEQRASELAQENFKCGTAG